VIARSIRSDFTSVKRCCPLASAICFHLTEEIARRALWHIPNSSEEVRNLVRYITMENLRQPNPLDDDPPAADRSPRMAVYRV
jgi:hypothetical protein